MVDVTLDVRYRVIGTNTVLPGGYSGRVGSHQDWPVTAGDAAYMGAIYKALFWNVSGSGNGLTWGANAVAHIDESDVTATGWYYQAGGGNGPPPPEVWVYCFSETQDAFVSLNPIDSVVPGAVPGGLPPWRVPTTAPNGVTITAKQQLGGEDFDRWLVVGSAIANGAVLTEAHNGYDWLAMACYGRPQPPRVPRLPPELRAKMEKLIVRVPKGDPATIDLVHLLRDRFGIPGPEEGQPDYLSDLMDRVDTLDKTTLRTSLAKVQAAKARLEAAETVLSKALGRGTK